MSSSEGSTARYGRGEPLDQFQAWLDAEGPTTLRPGRLRVLDAGCGRQQHLDFGDGAHLVGVDISERQLARNTALSEKIVGDIQTIDLPRQSFDVAVCFDVLEHLERPMSAVQRIAGALRPGGVLLLAFPNPRSVKGFVAKITPFSFHVWFYRKIKNNPQAGTADIGPFPTPMHLVLAPPRFAREAQRFGLEVISTHRYESIMQRRLRSRFGIEGWRWQVVRWLTRVISGGFLDAATTDVAMIMRRSLAPSQPTPAPGR